MSAISRIFHAQRNSQTGDNSEQPWIQTLDGGALDLLFPRIEQLSLRTICVVLCDVARWGRHTKQGKVSVGQHSVIGADTLLARSEKANDEVTKRLYRTAAAYFLVHDWHEYAIGDIATPVAHAIAGHAVLLGEPRDGDIVRRAIKAQKAALDVVIHAFVGLPYPLPGPVTALVKEWDARICRTEHEQRMDPTPRPHAPFTEPELVEDADVTPWPAHVAEAMFMRACRDLLPACGGDAGIAPVPHSKIV